MRYLVAVMIAASAVACTSDSESRSTAPPAAAEEPAARDCSFAGPALGFSHGNPYERPIWEGLTRAEKIADAAERMGELGAGWYRPHPAWWETEPVVDRPGLTLDGITEEMVEAYASGADPAVDWTNTDEVIYGITDAGLQLIVVVNGGYTDLLPDFIDASGERVLLGPDVAGREHYLALITVHVRATVRRYRERVRYWQIENELNVACETVLWGWREGDAWCDREFLTTVMATLEAAVHREDPLACTTHNLHSDLHWLDDLQEWHPYLDVVGIDAFPNYVGGEPVRAFIVSRRVGQTVEAAEGKPVIVLESGYPTAPTQELFSEENQAQFIREAVGGSFEKGGAGFFYFTLVTNEDGGDGLQQVEPYWGLFRRDGSRKLGWDAYRDTVAAVSASYRIDH